MKKLVFVLGLMLPPFIPLDARAQTAAVPAKEIVQQQVDSLVRARLASPQGAASMSVAIVRNGEPIVEQAWGTADAKANRAATSSTTYEIGSISKQFTASLILKLAERGKISVTDPLSKYLKVRPDWSAITIEQLLNHTSGLGRDYRPATMIGLLNTQPTDTLLAWALRDTLVSKPGTQHLYSNTGYMLLGAVIEKVYGKRYAEVLRDEIARPLGLKSLGWCTADKAAKAKGHARSADGTHPPALEASTDLALGAGGICATARDLSEWNVALHGGRVLSPASYSAMTTPRGAAVGDHYGFGMHVLHGSDGAPVFTHDGTTFGFVSENSYYPQQKLSVTVLYNSAAGPGTSPIAAQFARIALGQSAALASSATSGIERFVGFYEGRPGRGFDITLEKGVLHAQPTGSEKETLVLDAGTTYKVAELPVVLTFTLDDAGRVTGMVMKQNGMERTFPKVR